MKIRVCVAGWLVGVFAILGAGLGPAGALGTIGKFPMPSTMGTTSSGAATFGPANPTVVNLAPVNVTPGGASPDFGGTNPITEPLNTLINGAVIDGSVVCNYSTMFGNYAGVAYAKVMIDDSPWCGGNSGTQVYVSGAYGPVVYTSAYNVWFQSQIAGHAVLGEAFQICASNGGCGEFNFAY